VPSANFNKSSKLNQLFRMLHALPWCLLVIAAVDAAISAAWVPITTTPTAPAFTNITVGSYPYGRFMHWAVPTSSNSFAFGFGKNYQWTNKLIFSDIWNVSLTSPSVASLVQINYTASPSVRSFHSFHFVSLIFDFLFEGLQVVQSLARQGGMALFDSTDNQIVVFGGFNDVYFDDVWTFQLNTSTHVDVLSPLVHFLLKRLGFVEFQVNGHVEKQMVVLIPQCLA
jgi:hypothetical protein